MVSGTQQRHIIRPGASILVGLGGLEKAFLAKDSDGTELIPVLRAIAAGLFDFFARRTVSRSALSAVQVRAAIECPKDLVFVSTDVHAGFFHSKSRRSQRVLGLWVRVLAGVFHVGVSTPTFTIRKGAPEGGPEVSGNQLAMGLAHDTQDDDGHASRLEQSGPSCARR